MANIFDYLDWRGDLSFEVSPFNEVDNLIVSKLCCVALEGVVGEGDAPGLSVAEASRQYFALHGDDTSKQGVLSSPGILPMFKRLPDCPRFGSLTLSNYVSVIDMKSEEQFSALTVSGFPDGSHYIAYRGTDDTIVAWKENFNMSAAEVVPAQRDAAVYLERAAWLCSGPLRVGGHSKGGNLAVYSVLHADEEVKERVIAVYNNDGPGFRENVLATPEYAAIRERVVTILPQYSLVGMLLSHEEEHIIVKSSETGISAHDGFTWEILRDRFVTCEDFAFRSRLFESAIGSWVNDMDMERRQQFVDSFFDLLTSTGAVTLTDLSVHKLRQAMGLIDTLRAEPEQRELLIDALELLIREYAATGIRAIPLPNIPKMRLPSVDFPKLALRGPFKRKSPKGEPETPATGEPEAFEGADGEQGME